MFNISSESDMQHIKSAHRLLRQMSPLTHRVQRSEVRAEHLVFLVKDNRHTCVTRVT